MQGKMHFKMQRDIKNFLYILFCTLCLTCLPIPSVYAAAIQVYEFGTPTLGLAAVGQSVTQNASASYLNPAAMSALDSSELMLGSELIVTRTRFRPNTFNTFRGNDGNNAGGLLPGLAIFSVLETSMPELKFGLSLASPFAGSLNYNDGWVGRYFVQTINLITLDLNPSISYAINDQFSLGGGVLIEYAQLNETIGIPPDRTFGISDGQSDLRLRKTTPGFNLGLYFQPCCETKFGIAYRSKMHHRLRGKSTFLSLRIEPHLFSILKLPQGVIGSVSHDVTECWTVLGELGWSNWHTFNSTVIHIDDVTLTIPRNWKDTYRVGAASQFKVLPTLLFQLGASFDSSPTNAKLRLPDLPVDKQLRLGTGIVYTTLDCVELGLNYSFIHFGKAAIFHETRLGTLSGKYKKNIGNFFGLSLNVQL